MRTTRDLAGLGVRPAWLLLICLLAASPAAAVTFPWKAKFTEASSPALSAIHEQIHAPHPDDLKGYRVEQQIWTEDDFRLEIESGTIYLEPAIEGLQAGAFFVGKANFSFTPRQEGARGNLRTAFGRPALEKVPVETAYLFTLRADSPLRAWAGGSPVPAAPAKAGVYAADKSAMRQLGLELTTAFLTREGPAKGSTYVLMPMTEIRKSGSPEARVLYRMNPTAGLSVGLAVFGHQELTPVRPFKYLFHTLVSYAGARPGTGVADVEKTTVKVVPGAGSIAASEEATLQMKLAPGVKAVRLMFTPWMEVSRITDANGEPKPFLQWAEMKTHTETDASLLVLLAEAPSAAGSSATITVTSTGRLFEPWGNLYLLTAEDHWYPKFHSSDDAHHELELTIPGAMTGIGIGEKVLEEAVGQKKRVVFLTTQPNNGAVFYYGDYTMHQAAAGDVTVELYLDRKDLAEQRNARFVLGELTDALGYLSRTLCPLDITSMRAVSTPTAHARGFEGLILMGQMGRQTGSKEWTDISRAHEVAHQWWGQYVRIKYWPRDRWLHEALADYVAMEYHRSKLQDDRKWLHAIRTRWYEPLSFGTMERTNLSGQKEQLTGSTAYPLMAATDNVYTKGPMVLHMLRQQFRLQKDDDAFFAMLKDFLKSYRYQAASTDDFSRVAEKHLGESLDWFFRQWVTDGGVPVLVWHAETAPRGAGWAVTLQARQEQRNYRLDVPVHLHFPGRVETRNWRIEEASSTVTFETAEKPTEVTVNDDLTALVILKRMKAR